MVVSEDPTAVATLSHSPNSDTLLKCMFTGNQYDSSMRLRNDDFGSQISIDSLGIRQEELILMPTRELNKFLKVSKNSEILATK